MCICCKFRSFWIVIAADSVVHGLNLMHSPALNYCFYLCQIGVCMAPLAENALCVKLRGAWRDLLCCATNVCDNRANERVQIRRFSSFSSRA